MVVHSAVTHAEDDTSTSKKRRKQLHTREWVLGQGTYRYPLERGSREFGRHTKDNPPSPPPSTTSFNQDSTATATATATATDTPTTTTETPVSRTPRKRSVIAINYSQQVRPRGKLIKKSSPTITSTSTRKQRNKMSSDVATQIVDKVDGTVNKKNISSAGAATSLKRADPRQLPSFPSHGLSNPEASAGAAASLAAANPKTVEYWKPGKLPAAGAAASLAHAAATSQEASKSNHPASTLGSASAATALREAKDHTLYGTSDASEGRGSRMTTDEHGAMTGKAAAQLAAGSPSNSPRMHKLRMVKTTEDEAPAGTSKTRSRSGSMSSSSVPVNPALRAASLASTKASGNATGDQSQPGYDIERINKLALDKVTRELHGNRNAHNAPAAENRKNMDVRKAASLSMSPKLQASPSTSSRYTMPTTMRRSQVDTAASPSTTHAESSRAITSEINRRDSMIAASAAAAHLKQRQQQEQEQEQQKQQQVKAETRSRPYYHNLDEAAKKQAAERLRRLAEEHDSNRRGLGLAAARHQGLISSDSHDKESSRKIKSEMDTLGKRMAEVDLMKQARDSAQLLAKAQQNVQKQMQTMDTKVAEDKGLIPKHLQEQWDAKAREASVKAEGKRHEDEAAKQGKIDMGGGLWFSKDQLDKIAKSNVQPLLDDIEQAAMVQRAKEEEARLEKEEAERKKKLEAERKRDIKQDEKNAKLVAKELERQKREQEKQEKMQQREESRKVKEEKKQKRYEEEFVAVLEAGATGGVIADMERRHQEQKEPDQPEQQEQEQHQHQQDDSGPAKAIDTAEQPSEEHHHEDHEEKQSWLHSLGRKLSRKNRERREPGQFPAGFQKQEAEEKGEIGEVHNTSMRDIAMAGTEHSNTFVSEASRPLSSGDVSEVSSLSREEEPRSFNPVTELSPPHEHSPKREMSPVPIQRQTIDREELREERDEDQAAPLTSATFIPGSDVEPIYGHQRSSSASVRSAKSVSSKSAASHHSKEESKRRSLVGILTKPFRGRKEPKEESEADVQQESSSRPRQVSPLPADDERGGTRDTFGNMFKKSAKKGAVDPEVRKQHREAEVPDVNPSAEGENKKGGEDEEESDNDFSEAREDFFEDNTIDMPCQAQRAFEWVRQDPSEQQQQPQPQPQEQQHSDSQAQKHDHSQGMQSRFSEEF